MALENIKCFTCGGTGHLARNCTSGDIDDTKGSRQWCGVCDRRTRLILIGDNPARCPECHPLRDSLPQHRRCAACRQFIHSWDTSPCGQHSALTAADRRPDREHIDAIIAREAT